MNTRQHTLAELDRRHERLPMSPSEKAQRLDRTSWGVGIAYRDLETLGRYIDVFQMRTGSQLFREGDDGWFMAMVVDGQVDVVKQDSQGRARRIAQVRQGQTIGEMALIDGERRSAGAVAAEPTLVFVITQDAFVRLLAEHALVWGRLMLKIGRLMSQRLRAVSGQLVESLSADQAGAAAE